MTREEFIKKWGIKYTDTGAFAGFMPSREGIAEISADLDSLSLPPAEGAEAFVNKYYNLPESKIKLVRIGSLIKCLERFAAQQPKLDPKKVQWSGYGELGNISQKPLQLTAEGAEELLEKEFPLAIIDEDEWTGGVLKIMREFATLHAQRIADKMVSEEVEGD